MLAYECSREAVVLYAYILADCDSSGLCAAVYRCGANANLERKEMDAALDELIARGYVMPHNERVPVAEIGKLVVLGTRVGCRVANFVAPLAFDRLSPEAWGKLREAVFKRDDYTCRYCDERGGKLECDHVEPISKGGTNEMGNLVTACAKCNKSKRSKLISEWRANEGT